MTLGPNAIIFLCGCGGSLATEIVMLNQFMQSDSSPSLRVTRTQLSGLFVCFWRW
jgi:hypothetical protein